MIMETLKKDRMTVMKIREKSQMDKDKLAFLTTLNSEIAMFGKNNGNRETTEAEAVKIIQKFVTGAKETIEVGEQVGRDVSKSRMELEILSQYMPKQMTEAEVKTAVEEIVATIPDKKAKEAMGNVMAQLNAKFGGKYDGKAASAIVRAALQ